MIGDDGARVNDDGLVRVGVGKQAVKVVKCSKEGFGEANVGDEDEGICWSAGCDIDELASVR